MTCPDALELQSYFDRQLPADRQRALDEHISVCADCRAKVETLRTLAAVFNATEDAAPVDLQDRLLQSLSSAKPVRRLSCRRALRQLTPYIDGELKDSDIAALEAHVFTCESCFAALSEMRTVAETLAQRPRAVASEQLLHRIMGALHREAAQTQARERSWLRRAAWQPLVAGAAAAAIILAVTVFPRFTPSGIETVPTPDRIAAGPAFTEGLAPEAAVSPSAPAVGPVVSQPGALAAKPNAITRLSNALTGRRNAVPMTSTVAIRDSAPARSYSPPTWFASRPASSEESLRAPAGRPVFSSAAASLPSVAPVASETGHRFAALPSTATPGLADGEDHMRVTPSAALALSTKASPNSGADISLPRPAVRVAESPRSSGPELVPRRSRMREVYHSERMDSESLARAAERLNESVSSVRIANIKAIPIIH